MNMYKGAKIKDNFNRRVFCKTLSIVRFKRID